MSLRNSTQHYGWVSILLHWVMAIILISLYFMGEYMVDLDYYNNLYHTLPAWHKALGVLMALTLVLRLVWMYAQPRPTPLGNPGINHTLAHLGHLGLYGLLLIMIISGYLISTAKGKGIEVFGLFELPALLASDEQRGELAGKIHAIAGTTFIVLVGAHTLAALFHHVYWKDHTLTRMLGIKH